MSLFKKKNADNNVNYNKYFEEFLRFKDSKDRENEYEAMSMLYTQVYEFYKYKIKYQQLDIISEKLVLERRSGRYTSEKSKNNLTILIGMALALVPIYIQGFSELNVRYKAIISIVSVIGIFSMVVKDISKEIIRDKNRDAMFNVCLKVLDDIEKEMEAEAKLLMTNEVAATVQQEEKLKHMSQQANGNWNVEISVPSIINTIESVYKVGKFVRKVFRKG